MNATKTITQWPDCYLHVREMGSGQEWVVPIGDNDPIDLRFNLDKWTAAEMRGEIDGKLMPGLDGDYYGQVLTDGRPPTASVCWQGAGFYLKSTYE